MPDLPIALINGASAVGFVLGLGWMLALGWLATRGEVTRTTALYTLRIADLEHERDEWRSAAQIAERQIETVLDNQAGMRTQMTTITAFIESLPKDGQS